MIYIPIVGQAFWALDFPFMRRYSKEYLKKYPHKAGEDLKETQKACKQFSLHPTSVMNFLEGTRFTPQKHKQQNSPYQNLLLPKTGGLAFAIQALGDRFTSLTNITIAYPQGIPTFWELMCGKVKQVSVRVEELPIPEEFSRGDYQNDPDIRAAMQKWTSDIWQQKDELLNQLKHSKNV